MRWMAIVAGHLIVPLVLAAQRPFNPPSRATIVYDATLREFTCWSEGEIVPGQSAPCGPGSHPVGANLYFGRGEYITVLVVHAKVQDVFAVDLKVDDLQEPSTPVKGSLADLPSLQSIPALASVFPGTGAPPAAIAPAGFMAVRPAHELYRLLAVATDKDFKGYLKGTVLDPFSAKEVTDLLAVDLATASSVAERSASFIPMEQALHRSVVGLGDPSTMSDWTQAVKGLSLLVDRGVELRTRMVAAGLPSAGKTINDAILLSRSGAAQRALSAGDADLTFIDAVLDSIAGHAYTVIDAITMGKNGHFISSDRSVSILLAKVNAQLPTPNAGQSLAKLTTNLYTLADSGGLIHLAAQRAKALADVQRQLTAQREVSDGVYALQRTLVATVCALTATTADLNRRGRTIDLESPYDTLLVGQWFATKSIGITVKQGQRSAVFDVSAVADASRAGVTAGDVPATKAVLIPPTDLAPARALLVPVYNVHHLDLGLSFMYSWVRDDRFQVDSVTTVSGGATTTQHFIDQTRSKSRTLVPAATLTYFPWARHSFPVRARYPGEQLPDWYENIGLMAGLSVTNPTRDFLAGFTLLPPQSPIGIQVGVHWALRDYPPPNIDTTTALTRRVTIMQQRTLRAVTAGVILTTDFFTNVLLGVLKVKP